ncbi:MAG: histidine phosphatase family protein [Eubacteriales bacterium]|nr:histidine phosphatase family protein [Eubacteriales bacterium]MDD3882345.1 histidine phosphatase family protein [Eubacteriales bacterium]MDD4512434.1 histidine phosphatase family protein [Eubacteriales bacterium]
MKLVMIRHGDPDYKRDALTPRGEKEVAALTEYLSARPEADAYYVSPLGRAQLTARPTLEHFAADYETLPWLREFEGKMPSEKGSVQCWDMLPDVWTREGAFFDVRTFLSAEKYKGGTVSDCYEKVVSGIDALLEKYGYRRSGMLYTTDEGNNKTITLFCHLAVMFAVLSHLLNISPVLLWQGFHVAPTSITTVVTEEREQGKAGWRVTALGECPHLEIGGIEKSDAGLFRETYRDKDGIR